MALDKYSIMSKLRDYVSDSPKLRKKMKQAFKSSIENGNKIVNEAVLVELGSEYIILAKSIASQMGVPQSVINSMDTYYCGLPSEITVNEDGYARVTCPLMIDDESELRRYSLESLVKSKNGSIAKNNLYGAGQATGDGVDNIVKLLNNGYSASKYVYGVWYPNRSPEGHFTRSVKDRPPLHFMQEAAKEFEKKIRKTKRGHVAYGFIYFKYDEWN